MAPVGEISLASAGAIACVGAMETDYRLANCIDAPTEEMFPERGDNQQLGKRRCQGCVIQDGCLHDHLFEGFGIFGGTNVRERRDLVKLIRKLSHVRRD